MGSLSEGVSTSAPISKSAAGVGGAASIGSPVSDDRRGGSGHSGGEAPSSAIGSTADIGPATPAADAPLPEDAPAPAEAPAPADAAKPSSSTPSGRSWGAPVGGGRQAGSKNRQQMDIPAGALRVDADRRSAAVRAAVSRPQPGPTAGTPAGEVPNQRTAQQPAAATVDTFAVQQASPIVSRTAPVAAAAQVEAPAAPSGPVSRVVADTLAWAGLSSSLTDSPVAPVESPAQLALLAGWRRQSQQGLAGEAPTDLAQTGQLVDSMLTGDPAVAELSTLQAAAPVSLAAAADTTPPTVSLTTPANGDRSGTVTITATATDNVGVAGVQFLVNGVPLGAEDTTAPYTLTVPTTPANNGTYTLTAGPATPPATPPPRPRSPSPSPTAPRDTTPPTVASPPRPVGPCRAWSPSPPPPPTMSGWPGCSSWSTAFRSAPRTPPRPTP